MFVCLYFVLCLVDRFWFVFLQIYKRFLDYNIDKKLCFVRTMPQRCRAPMCKNVSTKNCKYSFHSFPKRDEMRQRWLNALGIETINWHARPRICSKHFREEDFVFGGNTKKLSNFAIPLIMSSSSQSPIPIPLMELNADTTVDINIARAKTHVEPKVVMNWEKDKENVTPLHDEEITSPSKPLKKRKAKTVKTPAKKVKTPINMSWIIEEVISEHEKSTASATTLEKNITSEESNLNTEKNSCSQCLSYLKTIDILENEVTYLKKENERLQQSLAPKPFFDILRFATNDKKISYYTGFQAYKLFLLVLEFLLPSGNIADIDCYNSKTGSRKHVTKLSAENQFFLTLMRLKRGMCLETIADLFSISKASVNNIFLSWINLMYLRLGSLDMWPNRNVLINRASASMLEKYPNIIGSIDCTEFFIQTPSSLTTQSQCYSNYKSTTTLKSLLMIDPGGAIIYISPLFTGSISDKAILEKTEFISILKEKVDQGFILPGDIILADKGFNVKQLFTDINLNLNIPVFRIGGQQFSSADVEETRKIAQERIHIERAIGRLKTYKILSLTKIPIASLGTINQIYTVCAILCNFKSALIR